jgi:hypothetical protein
MLLRWSTFDSNILVIFDHTVGFPCFAIVIAPRLRFRLFHKLEGSLQVPALILSQVTAASHLTRHSPRKYEFPNRTKGRVLTREKSRLLTLAALNSLSLSHVLRSAFASEARFTFSTWNNNLDYVYRIANRIK